MPDYTTIKMVPSATMYLEVVMSKNSYVYFDKSSEIKTPSHNTIMSILYSAIKIMVSKSLKCTTFLGSKQQCWLLSQYFASLHEKATFSSSSKVFEKLSSRDQQPNSSTHPIWPELLEV